MSDGLAPALDAARRYLLTQQAADGHWEDYRLPVGRSDAWVTGYVGAALAEASEGEAPPACRRAACWLTRARPYPAGWGFNGVTGPDADSTGFALKLLALCGQTPPEADVAWLRRRWRPRAGFSTYESADAWGDGHPDVTPGAFRALPQTDQAAFGAPVRECLQARRHSDGTWPSFWWRTAHYATFWSLLVLREMGDGPSGAPPVVRADETHGVRTAFDMAFVAGISALQQAPASLTQSLTEKLLALQQPDGAWPGGPNLRVTDPHCDRPWETPCGRLYTDDNHLITTASAVQVLSRIACSGPCLHRHGPRMPR